MNEWGNSPSRLVEAINRINDTNIRAQVRPFWLWIDNICLDTN